MKPIRVSRNRLTHLCTTDLQQGDRSNSAAKGKFSKTEAGTIEYPLEKQGKGKKSIGTRQRSVIKGTRKLPVVMGPCVILILVMVLGVTHVSKPIKWYS